MASNYERQAAKDRRWMADAARAQRRREDPSLEPDGGNLYRPHVFMIHSGQFWRCTHGLTGFAEGMKWVGCDACGAAEPDLKAKWHRDIPA